MEKTYPKSLGNVDIDNVVYYLEEKMGKEISRAVEDVLPELPDDDGDYFLHLTITDGEPEYSWESMSTGE